MSRDIISAIDGALNDWSVSADAMRWTPEPTRRVCCHSDAEHLEWGRPEQPRRAVRTDESVAAAWESATDLAVAGMVRDLASPRIPQQADLEMLRRLIRPHVRQVNEVFREFTRAFEKIRSAVPTVPDAPDEDVRARALRLRQTRNTRPAPVTDIRRHSCSIVITAGLLATPRRFDELPCLVLAPRSRLARLGHEDLPGSVRQSVGAPPLPTMPKPSSDAVSVPGTSECRWLIRIQSSCIAPI